MLCPGALGCALPCAAATACLGSASRPSSRARRAFSPGSGERLSEVSGQAGRRAGGLADRRGVSNDQLGRAGPGSGAGVGVVMGLGHAPKSQLELYWTSGQVGAWP